MRFLTSPASTHDPFAHLGRLRHEMERLFECAAPTATDEWAPPLTLHETSGSFEVRLPLPGVAPESVEIQLEQGVLRISGEREGIPENAARRYAGERPSGKFLRALELRAAVDGDAVTAQLRDGVLRVTLPKAAEALPRRIDVAV